MELLTFAGLLICVYFGTLFGFHFWLKKQSSKELDVDLKMGAGMFPLVGLILGLAGVSIIFGMPTPFVYSEIILSLFVVFGCAIRFPDNRAQCFWIPLSCALGTYVLCDIVPNAEVTFMNLGIIWVMWSLVMALVMFFDRLPLLNFLTIGAWSLAFAVMGSLNDLIPPEIIVPCLILFASLWGVMNILSRHMKANMGSYASAILGFVMGGIVAFCLAGHSYGSVMAMMGYYAFEGLLFVLAWIGFHPLNMKRGEFAFTSALLRGNPARIIRIVFYRLLILSLIAVMMWQTNRLMILFFIILVVLLDTYNRFQNYGNNAPNLKSMWQDTKTGFKKLWRHRSELLEKIPQPHAAIEGQQKKKSSKVVHKKSVQKNKVKKNTKRKKKE